MPKPKLKLSSTMQTMVFALAIIGTLSTAWLYMDGRFAHADDLKLVEINGLATSLEIRIDILEERIIRARKDGDTDSVFRMRNTLKKLLEKYKQVTKIQLDS